MKKTYCIIYFNDYNARVILYSGITLTECQKWYEQHIDLCEYYDAQILCESYNA